MAPSDDWTRPESVVRAVFATATVVFGGLGLLLREPRLLVAAGVCGALWTLWDVFWNRWIAPGGSWLFRSLTEGTGGDLPNLRPSLDDTIRLLENHLAGAAHPRVRIQAAIRLEEIFRTVKRDPARAREVLARARALFPDAPELAAPDRERESAP
jgi:hypothetical protein